MSAQQPLIDDFLAQDDIAVVGLSRNKLVPANAILAKLVKAGYRVTPIHPHAESFEDIPCARSLTAMGHVPAGVVLATSPAATDELVDESLALGIPRLWMHDMMGTCPRIGRRHSERNSSVSHAAAERARQAGASVITGSCPNQFVPPLDAMHRGLHWFNRIVGNTR